MSTENEIKEEEKKDSPSTIGGLIFVGCMFIGMGIGHYINSMETGLMSGMGVGFIAMAIVWAKYKNK